MLLRNLEHLQYPSWEVYQVRIHVHTQESRFPLNNHDEFSYTYSPNGGFVDQAGVALTAGGGTLVLSTHDRVRASHSIFLS